MANYKNKYTISKTNGKPIDPEADYFVLRLDTDPFARIALIAYANSVRNSDKEFADQLDQKLAEYNL